MGKQAGTISKATSHRLQRRGSNVESRSRAGVASWCNHCGDRWPGHPQPSSGLRGSPRAVPRAQLPAGRSARPRARPGAADAAPPSALGGAGSPSGRALARAAVVYACEFPKFTQAPGWHGNPATCSRAACLRTRRCHRRSPGQSLSHDAPRQPSPQWAAM
jgi:hypothetical protein